jgi:hypothetical protein
MKKETVLLLIVVGLLLIGGTTTVYTMTRGLRNNNPGNIRRSNTAWEGLSPTQTDDGFFQFASPVYGIRAMARILQNYFARGIVTPATIASTWAPPNENDSAAYSRALSQSLGVDVNDDVSDRLADVIAGIIRQENGVQPYTTATITQGVQLA